MLVPFAEGHVLRLKTALQEEIGKRLQQIFSAQAEIVAGELGITNPLHSAWILDLVELPPRGTPGFAAFGRVALPLGGHESDLLVAADAAMGVQTLQNKFGCRCAQRIRLISSQSERPGLLHQTLNVVEL